MFERFTRDARETVTIAQQEARELRHGAIGTEHLLLGLLATGSPTAQVLARHGLTREVVVQAITAHVGGDDLDAEALNTIGIDLDAIRDHVEAAFGRGALDKRSDHRSPGSRGREPHRSGHVPFAPRAKKVLELSLREALALKHTYIADGHVLLGLIREGEGLAMKVIADRGIDVEELRREIRSVLVP